jgi:anti-sigma regulatory factor (Ser/Thr protein kinase)
MQEMLDWPRGEFGSSRGWLDRTRRAPGLARKALRDLLLQAEGGERFMDDAQLLVSELVTNALKHGTRPGQRIWYGFELHQDVLGIAVEDPSAKQLIPRQATDQHEAGRGLVLIEELALQWGVGPRNGPGKRVWVTCGPAPLHRHGA